MMNSSNHWKATALRFFIFSAGALLCGQSAAQQPGMEISGFRVPEYDDQGVMTSQLFGEHAEMETGGQVEITAVRMEFYRDGETFMEVTSPYCFFDQKSREAWSDAPVAADMEGVRVRGRGFRLQSGERKVQVLNDSRVMIDDVPDQTEEGLLSVAGSGSNQTTVITSKELFLDYDGRTVRFENSVHVQDTRMEMDCGTMTLRFGENNQIDWIEALREVRILSEGREAQAGKAVYDVTTDEFLLEENPKILEGRNMLLGDQIRFWRVTGRMVCKPSARLIIYPDDKTNTKLFEN